MTDCIFCKIVAGQVPCKEIYSDSDVMAFLDVNPVSPGHTLIIPKKHYVELDDIPEELLMKIAKIAKKLTLQYKKKLNNTGTNILNASGKDAQQSVGHFHLHLVPRYHEDGLDLWFHGRNKGVDLEKIYKKLK